MHCMTYSKTKNLQGFRPWRFLYFQLKSNQVRRVVSRSLTLSGGGDDMDAAVLAGVEVDGAVGDGEQRVIAPLADVAAGMKAIADLAHDDVAGDDRLAAELLDAAALTVRITTVARRTLTFFMCHD